MIERENLEKLIKGKWGAFLCSCLITGLYFLCLYFLHPPIFALNDDMMIESIFSGGFLEPYSKSFYFSTELGLVISGLYKICPTVPWLGILYTFGGMLCFFLLQWRIWLTETDSLKKKTTLSVLAVLGISAMYLRQFVLLHYTVLSALLGATGLILFVKAGKSRRYFLPACLFLCSYLIRENVFFMLCPFIFSAAVFLVIEDQGKRFKRDFISAICFFAAFLILFLVNRLSLRGRDWEEYLQFNETRTNVYDYLGVSVDDAAMEYYQANNVSKGDIALIASYNIALLSKSQNGYDALSTVEKYGLLQKEQNANGLFRTFKISMYRFLFQKEDAPWNWIVLVLYGIALALCIADRKWLTLIPFGVLGISRCTLWMILIQQGRYPERVTFSLYFLEITVITAMLASVLENSQKSVKRFAQPGAVVLGLILAVLSAKSFQLMSQDYQRDLAVNRVDDRLYEDMRQHPEDFYFLDVYSTVYRTKLAWSNENDGRQNYLLLGGWMIGHPLYLKKLQTMFPESQNIKDILLEKDNAYLVMKKGVGIKKETLEESLGVHMVLERVLPADGDSFLFYRLENAGD